MDDDTRELASEEELRATLGELVEIMNEALEYCSDLSNPVEKRRHALVNYLESKRLADAVMAALKHF